MYVLPFTGDQNSIFRSLVDTHVLNPSNEGFLSWWLSIVCSLMVGMCFRWVEDTLVSTAPLNICGKKPFVHGKHSSKVTIYFKIYKFSVSEHYLLIFENGIDSGISTLDRCKIPVLQLLSRGFYIHFDFVKIWGYQFLPPAPPPPPALLPSPNSTASSSLAIVVMWTCNLIYYKYNLLSLFCFACMNVLLGLTTIIG